jgi:hypothetical protein
MVSRLAVASLVVTVAAAAAVGAFLLTYHGGSAPAVHIQDVLIITSATGFNDSAEHGVPQNAWPIIHTTLGTTLNITIENTDHQSHGFQVAHYYDNSVVAIPAWSYVTAFAAAVALT